MAFSAEIISYLFVGGIAGVLAGLLGVGGGIIVVPALLWLLPDGDIESAHRMHVAVATSLLVMIPTALSSAYRHFQQGNLDPILLRQLGFGIFLGSLCGVGLASLAPRQILQLVFALFELLVAYEMLRPHRPPRVAVATTVNRVELFGVGSLIGALSSLLGIGGGTMTVPYLAWRGIDMRRAIATSAACGFIIAVTGALVFSLFGPDKATPGMFGYLYLPAAIAMAVTATLFARFGATLSQTLSVLILRRLLGIVLVVVAVKLLW